MKILIFTLNNHRYSVLLSAAERVLRMVEITPLPNAPDMVLGIINMHGTIIPVFNIRNRFGLPEHEFGIHDQLIIAHTNRRKVALAVESVEGIMELTEKPVSGTEVLPSTPYINTIVKLSEGITLVIDLDGFLSLHEENALLDAISQRSE